MKYVLTFASVSDPFKLTFLYAPATSPFVGPRVSNTVIQSDQYFTTGTEIPASTHYHTFSTSIPRYFSNAEFSQRPVLALKRTIIRVYARLADLFVTSLPTTARAGLIEFHEQLTDIVCTRLPL